MTIKEQLLVFCAALFVIFTCFGLPHLIKEKNAMLLNKDVKKDPFKDKQIIPVGSQILVKFEMVTSVIALPEGAQKSDNFELFPTVIEVGADCKRVSKGDTVMLKTGPALKSGMIVIGEDRALVEEGFVAAIIK